jgi:hypothetical protein
VTNENATHLSPTPLIFPPGFDDSNTDEIPAFAGMTTKVGGRFNWDTQSAELNRQKIGGEIPLLSKG